MLETLALTWSRRKGKEKTEKDSRDSTSHELVGVFIPAETGQTGRSATSPSTRSHLTVEVLSSKRSLLRDAAMLMKIQFMVLEGPRNPGRWPVLRKPPKLHAREDSHLHAVALDGVPVSAF